jgi:hypothetical protein
MINKKASMELGISTVVVLVIAMVIIAGGIAFIRGFFKQGTDKLGGAFEIADFGVEPTAIDPLVLVEGSPTIKSGARESVKVAFYNTGSGDATAEIGIVNCVSTAATPQTCDKPVPIITSLPISVKPGESKGFETFVTAACKGTSTNPALLKGEYICTLVASPDGTIANYYAQKQITLTIES